MIRRVAHGVGALLVVGTLASCSGSDDDSSADATSSKPSPACALLTAKDRQALAGAPVDEVTPIEAVTGTKDSLPQDAQCRWTSGQLLIQAASLPATEWAETVPAVLDRLEDSGATLDAKAKRGIAEARTVLKSSKNLTDVQACDLFATIAEIGGAPKDSDTLVSYTQISQSVLAVSAQTCRSGTFASVVDASPKLKQTSALTKAAGVAVAAAHKRALAAG